MLSLETGEAGLRDAERVGAVSRAAASGLGLTWPGSLQLRCLRFSRGGRGRGQKRACQRQFTGLARAALGIQLVSGFLRDGSSRLGSGAWPWGRRAGGWLCAWCFLEPEMSPTGAGGCWLGSAGSFAQIAVLAAVGRVPRSHSKQEGGIHLQERV